MQKLKEITPYFRQQHMVATLYDNTAEKSNGESGGAGKDNQPNNAITQQKTSSTPKTTANAAFAGINAAQTAANAIAGMRIPALPQTNAQTSGGNSGGGSGGNSPYVQQLNTLYDQIVNRKPFKYDVNGDLLYRQMADQAMKNGALAARNAMGQAAALTGGYGNSYAEQVAAQAYQQNMAALNDNIPELYQQALNAYLAEGDQLLQQYELAAAHPGYLQAMQPTGSGGGAKAADVDYNSILQAMVNGIGAVSNAAAAKDPVLYNYYDLQKYLNK